MKIYLDFDRTLFNTNAFLDEIYKIVNKYDISKNIFDKSKLKLKDKGFNIKLILQEVEKEFSFNHQIYEEMDNLIENSCIFLYNDVLTFLKKLKVKNYEVILLTKGNEEFQKKKIKASKISNYFDDIIITLKNKGDLDIDYQAIFVDDREKELLSILKRHPKKLYYINRSKQNKLDNSQITTIYSLEDVEL